MPAFDTENQQICHPDLNDLEDLQLKLEVDYIVTKQLPEIHSQIIGPWKNVSLPLRRLAEDYALAVDRLQAIYEELRERRVI